jgi:hypothetical protein
MSEYTTLNKIRLHGPCADGWAKLLRHLGKTQPDDEPLALTTILDSNGLDDALWCLRACDGIDREARLYAVWCVRQVQHLMTDPRSLAALNVAERHANGNATDKELAAASAAARAAASAAARDAARAAASAAARDAAWDAAMDAAMDAVRDAAWAAARDAAWDAAMDAVRDAAWAAARDAAWDAAMYAARAAAWDAAMDAARAAQATEFRRRFA